MKATTIPLVLLLGAALSFTGAAADEEPAAASEQATATEAQSSDASEQATAPAAATTADTKELKLPPEFRKVKRGKYTLYCRRETPLGTRFKTTTCYDENQMRQYILALEQTKGDVDRIRNICSNPCVCGMSEAC